MPPPGPAPDVGDRRFREDRWSQVLREHADQVARRPPNERLVGHRPIDPATGAETAAAGQVQVSVDDAVAALDHDQWTLVIAEDRSRSVAGSGVDAVICARRSA